MPDRTPNPPTSTTDFYCLQRQPESHPRSIPAYIVYAALRDLACILGAKKPLKTAPCIVKTPRAESPKRAHPSTLGVTDMKFPSSASITFKKTTPPPSDKQDTSHLPTENIVNNSDNMLSPEGQAKQPQQQGSGFSSDDNNNLSKNTGIENNENESVPMNGANSFLNSNLNENRNRRMRKKNDNDKDYNDNEPAISSRPKLYALDSGFSSSFSDEDATDRTSKCQCDNKQSRFRSSRRLRHRLSFSRSQSWSSLDSGVGDSNERPGTHSPSASSVSSLSSMWSLGSSGNNLSNSPSLDSQTWSSVVVSSAEVSVSEVPTSTGSHKASSPDTDSCEAIVPGTLRNSEFSTVKPEKGSSLSSESVSEREQEEFTDNSVSLVTRNDIRSAATSTFTLADVTASPEWPGQARLAQHARRRSQGCDHNNNTDHSRAPQEFLPNAVFRLGDCFQKKGLLSLVALIIYLFCLMAGFALLAAISKGLKAAVGKQDLKEMRRSLSRSRRSRRTPATSG